MPGRSGRRTGFGVHFAGANSSSIPAIMLSSSLFLQDTAILQSRFFSFLDEGPKLCFVCFGKATFIILRHEGIEALLFSC